MDSSKLGHSKASVIIAAFPAPLKVGTPDEQRVASQSLFKPLAVRDLYRQIQWQ